MVSKDASDLIAGMGYYKQKGELPKKQRASHEWMAILLARLQ
jgi:hypothetical protein